MSANLQGALKPKCRSVRDERKHIACYIVMRVRIAILSDQCRFSLLAVVPVCREPGWVHVSRSIYCIGSCVLRECTLNRLAQCRQLLRPLHVVKLETLERKSIILRI